MTEFRQCAVNGCDGNAHPSKSGRKGYCSPHYERLWRHGDPLAGRTKRGSTAKFLKETALMYEGDDCLIWPYYRMPNGYAQAWVGGKQWLAHRYVCTVAHGSPPTASHEASHSCGRGTDGCVTKRHLSWKTHSENMADQLVHGSTTRGERNAAAKLTEAQAREIIALKGVKTPAELAGQFGVQPTAIKRIQTGKRWAWLNEGAQQ
jgi:hypothetical protein